MRDSAGVRSNSGRRIDEPFPQLPVEGTTILLAGLLLLALLAIAAMVVGYEVGKLRGNSSPPASPAPAGQVGSGPPAVAVSLSSPGIHT